MKKKNKVNPVLYIILCIGLSISILSGGYLFKYYYGIYKTDKTYNDLRNDIGDEEDDNKPVIRRDAIDADREKDPNKHSIRHSKYDKLYEKNSDFVGWLEVPGTVIDYPVMQTKKNEQYYIHRNFYGKYDEAGTLFCNAIANLARPSDNTIIYGHNMKYGAMFHDLSKFESEEFYEKHKLFYFDTIYRSGVYEIIGTVKTDLYNGSFEYFYYADCNSEEFYKYVNFIKNKSLYKTKAIENVEYGDILVTLSTCSYHVSGGKGRILVIGKLIETDDPFLT